MELTPIQRKILLHLIEKRLDDLKFDCYRAGSEPTSEWTELEAIKKEMRS